MTENKQFRLVNELGDYHIKDGDDELCYDLCSPSMAKENWNNVVNRLNELAEENKKQKDFINQLQEELVFFKTANVNVILKLEEENEKLKQEVEEYKEAMKRMMIDMMR